MDRAAAKDILLIELNNSFISIISFYHKSKKILLAELLRKGLQ